MTSHTQTGDSPSCSGWNGWIVFVDPIDQFDGDVGFILKIGVDRAVEIPTSISTVGTNDDHIIKVGKVFYGRYFGYPAVVSVAISVKKIKYGKFCMTRIRVGGDYYGFYVFLHFMAVRDNGIDFCRLNAKKCR